MIRPGQYFEPETLCETNTFQIELIFLGSIDNTDFVKYRTEIDYSYTYRYLITMVATLNQLSWESCVTAMVTNENAGWRRRYVLGD